MPTQKPLIIASGTNQRLPDADTLLVGAAIEPSTGTALRIGDAGGTTITTFPGEVRLVGNVTTVTGTTFTTDATFQGNVTFGVAPADTVTFASTTTVVFSSMTAGSVLFAGASGTLSQDNANLFWDNTNNRLGVGTNAPSTAITAVGKVSAISTTASGNCAVNATDASGSGHYAEMVNYGTSFAGSLAGETLAGSSFVYATGVNSTKLVIGHLQQTKPVIVVQSSQERLRLTGNGTTGETVFNDLALNADFRVESQGNANMLVVDASANAVGIGTNAPVAALDLASGQLAIPDGTAAAPAIAFRDDLNNGIFSPGTDQLAISTAGTQRMVVDASGRVGVGTATPNSTLQVAGSLALPITALSTATTLDATHYTVLCNGTFTVTLPAASTCAGRIYNVKNVGTGTITVDGNASETIDGATTYALSTQYQTLTLQCDGSNWFIL